MLVLLLKLVRCNMLVIKETIRYLKEVFGFEIDINVIHVENTPIFITEQYLFYSLCVENTNFLGVILRDPKNFKLTAFEKHQKYFPLQGGEIQVYKGVVLIAEHLSGFARKRLIEDKTSFVVPNVQLYWPELGLAFRSYSKIKAVQKTVENFNPATQAVLIGALNGCYQQQITPKELAEKLYYSPMSMTRALNSIEVMGIGEGIKRGKQRFISFPERGLLWEQAKDMLNDPVQEAFRLWKHDIPDNCKLLAGESALAKVSALVNPRIETYAVSRGQWKKLKAKAILNLTVDEADICSVQVWRYDPALFAQNGMVDIFSLYLSLKNETDERVELAMQEALEARL